LATVSFSSAKAAPVMVINAKNAAAVFFMVSLLFSLDVVRALVE
jgi:hypothetical protein